MRSARNSFKKMRIAYFDFNCSSFFENFSAINPSNYGGGGVMARYARQLLNNDKDEFWVFAPEECFKDVKTVEDRPDRCIKVPKNILEHAKRRISLDKLFTGLEQFDILLHHNTCEHGINKGNLKIPLCQWTGSGLASAMSYGADYALLYNHNEKTTPFPHQKIKHIIIGKKVPKEFVEYKKDNYVIQVSQHSRDFNTLEVCVNCKKYNLPLILAGPIFDYPELNEYIDGKLIKYLGQITENEKLELYKKARLLTLLNKNIVPFNQTVIESQGLGVPILVNNCGPFFEKYLKENVNGFSYTGDNFLKAYQDCDKINQKDCWESASEYSIEKAVDSFYKAFQEIISEWNYNR